MNIPIPSTIPSDSNFSSTKTTLYSSNLILNTDIAESVDFSNVTTNKKQGTIRISQINIGIGEFKNLIVNNSQINTNSVIFISMLSCEPYITLILSTPYINDGSFIINAINVGTAAITNEDIKVAFLTIN